ncbi:hypothetical protein V6N13_059777 [Hibiscus sabdariffa]
MLQLHLCRCFNNLPQQDDKGDVLAETRGPAWAAALADIQISVEHLAELFWVFGLDCISSALLCFDLLLLSYVVHLILNLPRNPSFVFSIAFAILASVLLDFKMHWWVLKDLHHMAYDGGAGSLATSRHLMGCLPRSVYQLTPSSSLHGRTLPLGSRRGSASQRHSARRWRSSALPLSLRPRHLDWQSSGWQQVVIGGKEVGSGWKLETKEIE